MKEQKVIWEPQPGSQALFLTSPYFETLFAGTRGCGKAQPLDAKILTKNDYVEMGELYEGAKILNPNGKEQKVIEIFPQGHEEIFIINVEGNISTEASLEHLWMIYGGRIVNTEYLINNYQNNLEIYRYNGEYLEKRKILSVISNGYKETQCIKVSDNNSLYITDNGIVTHNTDALLMDYAQHVGVGFGIDWRGIIFRQTFAQLADVISKTKKFFYQIFPKAKFNEANYKWVWPDGEELLLRYFEKDDHYWNYHGAAFPFIGWEELCNWNSDYPYEVMKSCCRSTNPDLPRKYRATTNPYGPGHCIPFGEVLTPKGWKNIRDFKVGDEVYSVDENRHIIETKVDQVHKEWVEENLIIIKNVKTYMNMTKNHSVPQYRNGFFDLREISDIINENNKAFRLLKSAKLIKDNVNLEKELVDFIELCVKKGYFGDKNVVKFMKSALEKEEIFIIKRVWDNGLEVKIDEVFKKYKYLDKIWGIYENENEWGNENYGHKIDINNRIEFLKYLVGMPYKYLGKIVLELVLIYGEYHFKNQHGYIIHSDKKFVDYMSTLLVLTGFGVWCRQKADNYKLTFERKGFTEINVKKENSINEYHYKGFVYCLGIKNTHTFIVRQKNKIWISGNSWVKKYFIDPAPPGTPVKNDMGQKRVYLRGTIYENKALIDNDPMYIKNLEAIEDENRRKAWLWGEWDLNVGGIFDGIWDRNIHVIEPFEIPYNWFVRRSFDWGSAKPYSLGIWAESNGEEVELANGEKRTFTPGTVFRIGELYGFSGKANEGVYETPREIAENIIEYEKRLGLKQKIYKGPADTSMFDTSSFGTSIAGEIARAGVFFKKADKKPGSRIAGLEKVRTMLKNSLQFPMEKPGLFIFETCTQFIRTVPTLTRDPKNLDDVDTNTEDHIWDETRYMILDNGYRPENTTGKYYK